jgi:hypothetical protein
MDKLVLGAVSMVNVSLMNEGVLASRLGWRALFILFRCLDDRCEVCLASLRSAHVSNTSLLPHSRIPGRLDSSGSWPIANKTSNFTSSSAEFGDRIRGLRIGMFLVSVHHRTPCSMSSHTVGCIEFKHGTS